MTSFILFQVQQKILARGDISVEDEIADSVFVQVSLYEHDSTPYSILIQFLVLILMLVLMCIVET